MPFSDRDGFAKEDSRLLPRRVDAQGVFDIRFRSNPFDARWQACW